MKNYLRWNSWKAFLVDISGHKLEFFLGFYPHFSILLNVSQIVVRISKTREEYVWFSLESAIKRDPEQHGAKDSSLLLNRCPRFPSREIFTLSSCPEKYTGYAPLPFLCPIDGNEMCNPRNADMDIMIKMPLLLG